MDRCIIIGAKNGFPKKKNFTKRDYIIAADGGLEYCIQNKIVPDYIVGDFDSFGHVPLELLKEPAYSNTKLKQYPREKDDTDTAMAIAYGQEMGYRNFVLMGCQGGRIDHTIANIQCMKKLAQQNIKCVMYGDDYCMRVLHNEAMVLMPEQFRLEEESPILSIFSLEKESKKVTIKGAKYEAEDISLYDDRALGVSNCFDGKKIDIEVKEGTLLVMWQGEE